MFPFIGDGSASLCRRLRARRILGCCVDCACQWQIANLAAQGTVRIKPDFPFATDVDSGWRNPSNFRCLLRGFVGDFKNVEEECASAAARIAHFNSPRADRRLETAFAGMIVLGCLLQWMAPRFLAWSAPYDNVRLLRQQGMHEHSRTALR